MMELSHLLTKNIMVAVVTLLTLCFAIGVQGQTTMGTGAATDLPTTAMFTDGMDTSTVADMTTSTKAGMTTKTQKMTTSKVGTTGKTEPSSTTPGSSPVKGGFKWVTFFCIIILIGCLIGIGYCAYQFYRKRQNDSYHTL